MKKSTKRLWVFFVSILSCTALFLSFFLSGESAHLKASSQISNDLYENSANGTYRVPPENSTASFLEDMKENAVIPDPMQPYILMNTDDMPEDISPASSIDEVMRYIIPGGAYALMRSPYRYFGSFTSITQWNQDNLFFFLYFYAQQTCSNDETSFSFGISVEDSQGITYTTVDGDVISQLIENLFGVSDYIIPCQFYDSSAHVYRFSSSPSASTGVPLRLLTENIKWSSPDALSFDIYETNWDENSRHTKTNWQRVTHFLMTRVNGRMVFSSVTREENPSYVYESSY